MQRMTYPVMICLLLIATSSQAAEWGDLSMTFVYDGTPPAPAKANVNKDVAFCGKFNVIDETLLVNQDNGGIANIAAFLYVARGGKTPSIHPDYEKTAKAEVKLDNNKCRFEPHMTILRTTQTLIVGNSDTVGHNTNLSTLANPPQNVLVPAGGELKLNFPAEERFPVNVACNIHPWMNGKVVIRDDPYAAASDENGKILIKNLPVGKWTFQFWHVRPGYVTDVTVGGKKTTWKRGRVELTIKPGQNDLGTIKVSASHLAEKN